MVTIVFINFKLLASFNDVDLVLAMYGGDDEDTLRQWEVSIPGRPRYVRRWQRGGHRTPRSKVAFLSTATISSVQASSIFSLVEL